MSVCPLSRIADALERIAANLDAETILAERRFRDAQRKRNVRGQTQLKRTEEGNEEKSPHTPLKGVREEEKKMRPSTRAHARDFEPPTLDEVTAYCKKRKNKVDPIAFWHFYAAKGWMIGKNKMMDWRDSVITWERDPERQPFTGKYPVDAKTAIFERQQAEAKERFRHAAELARRLMAPGGKL